jgi:hypothetical protein
MLVKAHIFLKGELPGFCIKVMHITFILFIQQRPVKALQRTCGMLDFLWQHEAGSFELALGNLIDLSAHL